MITAFSILRCEGISGHRMLIRFQTLKRKCQTRRGYVCVVLALTAVAILLFMRKFMAQSPKIVRDIYFHHPLAHGKFARNSVSNSMVNSLAEDLQRKIKDMKTHGYLRTLDVTQKCSETVSPVPCVDYTCPSSISMTDKKAITEILQLTSHMNESDFTNIETIFGKVKERKQVVMVTGASSNHFKEAQGLLRNLHTYIFPQLKNFSLYFYDLGLTREERHLVEMHCRCKVRSFPFSRLKNIHLNCYTWKPLIVQAHISSADMLFWFDSSVRFFPDANMSDILEELKVKGSLQFDEGFPISDHTQPQMFKFFGHEACQFSRFTGMDANFIGLNSERLIWLAVVQPWVACALDSDCMCPESPQKYLHCDISVRRYSKCHRFDQAAISIVLTKLYREYTKSLSPYHDFQKVQRGVQDDYFSELERKKVNI